MRRVRSALLLTISALALGACQVNSEADDPSGPLNLAPCSLPGIDRPAECGTLVVPENRKRPARTIALHLVLLRATEPAGREAVFFITGGPGSAATASARPLAREHAALAVTHDFVFVDQRGTGQSNPLECAAPDQPGLPPMFSAEGAASCRKALEPVADLLAYTTADAVADLEAVRRALGYNRINLHGSSYGTRPAWAYAARFPQHARTLVLHGPVPPDFRIPLPFAQGLEIALNGVVADCLGDQPCAERFPQLKADVERAFERLSSAPARVKLDGDTETLLSRGELSEAVRYLLYSAVDARRLPLLLTAAAAGDYTPIARASANYRRGLMRGLNTGMYLSVTCAEDIPYLREPEIVATSRNTKLGDYRARQQIAACSAWPRGQSQASDGKALQVPALILVGAYDPATPLESARRGAALLPNSRMVVVPHGAHAFGGLGIDDCLAGIATTFMAAGTTTAVDGSCVTQARRPAFVLQ